MWLFLANPLYLHNSCRICSHYLRPTSSMKAVEGWAVMHSCIHLWGSITDSSPQLASNSWLSWFSFLNVGISKGAQVKFCFSVLFLKRIISEVRKICALTTLQRPCFGSQHPQDTLITSSHIQGHHTHVECVRMCRQNSQTHTVK